MIPIIRQTASAKCAKCEGRKKENSRTTGSDIKLTREERKSPTQQKEEERERGFITPPRDVRGKSVLIHTLSHVRTYPKSNGRVLLLFLGSFDHVQK